jgi:transposase InsO family protein
MDVFTRAVRGWHLTRHVTEEVTCTALHRALAVHPAPEIHHSDQGMQYASARSIELLHQAHIQSRMAAVGCPTQNAYAERLIRTLKEEEVYLHEYETYEEASHRIG